MSEETWSRRSSGQDYITTVISGSSGRVQVSTATSNAPGCVGYATAAPSISIYWVRENLHENERLRVFYVSRDESSLIIRKPDGTWLCNDDSFGTGNPTVDIERPRTGNYSVWIASESSLETSNGILYTTLEDYDPQQYPLQLSDPFVPVITGAGGIGGLLYVESHSQSDRLTLSIDAYLRNMDGSQRVRVAAWPLDSNGRYFAGLSSNSDENGNLFASEEFVPRYGSSDFDYSNGGAGPIELSLLDSAFRGSGITYSVDIRVQIFDRSNNQWVDLDYYSAYGLPPIRHTT